MSWGVEGRADMATGVLKWEEKQRLQTGVGQHLSSWDDGSLLSWEPKKDREGVGRV